MAEVQAAVAMEQPDPEVAEECADVVIVLCRLAAECGADLWEAVERKMAVNRQRKWKGWHHVA